MPRPSGVPRAVDAPHDALGSVAEVLDHLADAALGVESHDREEPARPYPGHRLRVAPVGAGARQRRLPEAGVGIGEEPDLVDLPAFDPRLESVLADDRAVVDEVGLVEAVGRPGIPTRAPGREERRVGVAEAVDLDGVGVEVEPSGELVADVAARAGGQLGGVVLGEASRVAEAEERVQAPPALGLDDRVVVEDEHARSASVVRHRLRIQKQQRAHGSGVA